MKVLLAVLALSAAGATVALAQEVAPDSVHAAAADTVEVPAGDAPSSAADSLGNYLRTLADSTDAFFGASGAPIDTVGLDSVLTFRLAHPDPMSDMRHARASWAPWLSFNRADGPLYGGVLTLGRAEALGAISGRLGYAAGPNDLLGGGIYRKRWGVRRSSASFGRSRRRADRPWTVEISGGRFTTVMDPDRSVSWQRVLRAFLNGSDRHHYFRRDGVQARLERESARWRAALVLRDQLESPLPTTATWNLFHSTPEVIDNLPAAFGRAREIQLEAGARAPWLPIQGEIGWRVSSDALASDFEYQRLALTLGGDFGLGPVGTLVPQVQYGRLTGDLVPQAGFYLGGTHSIRSLPTNSLAGTGKALGRLDLIFTPDLPRVLRLPVPAFVVVQGALFAGSGAVWGGDPFGGPARPGRAWPERQAWISEVGASLLYRPGLPEPRGFMRLDYAHGVGGNTETKISLHYTVPLDLLRAFE